MKNLEKNRSNVSVVSIEMLLVISGVIAGIITGAVKGIMRSNSISPSNLRIDKIQTGDKLTLINIPTGETLNIKLACIDAPRASQPENRESKYVLVDLLAEIKDPKLTLNTLSISDDRTLISELYINNININQHMVAQGAAVINPEYFNCLDKDGYLFSQKIAKDNELRIWSNPDFIMPWNWEKGKRG